MRKMPRIGSLRTLANTGRRKHQQKVKRLENQFSAIQKKWIAKGTDVDWLHEASKQAMSEVMSLHRQKLAFARDSAESTAEPTDSELAQAHLESWEALGKLLQAESERDRIAPSFKKANQAFENAKARRPSGLGRRTLIGKTIRLASATPLVRKRFQQFRQNQSKQTQK